MLARSPDSLTLLGLVNQLNANVATRSDEALTTLTSDEYRTDSITGVYSQFLHRTPASSELTPLLTAMQSGTTDQQVVATVLSGNEYYNLAQSVPEPAVVLFGFLPMLLAIRRR